MVMPLTEKDGGREASIRRLQNLRRLDPQSQVLRFLPAHHSPARFFDETITCLFIVITSSAMVTVYSSILAFRLVITVTVRFFFSHSDSPFS